MSYLTRSKVAYDLNISPHSTEIEYGECKIKFIFSSDLYRRKFLEKLEDNRKSINESLSNRFGYVITVDMISDLKLYSSVEKRGFLIFKDGEKIECRNSITLDGNQMMINS